MRKLVDVSICSHLAIDPGASGGIAAMFPDGSVTVYKMPYDLKTLRSTIKGITSCAHNSKLFVEKVGFHMKGNSAGSSAKFAKHVGEIRGLIVGLLGRLPDEEVPHSWMKHFGEMPKDKKERKNYLKSLAAKAFPGIKITLWNADALMMLKYIVDKKEDLNKDAKSNNGRSRKVANPIKGSDKDNSAK